MKFFDKIDKPTYKYYKPKTKVLGKSMEEHLRLSCAFWHTLCYQGRDIFGDETMDRPWKTPEEKIDAGFEFMQKLGIPFFAFHDVDVAPVSYKYIEKQMSKTGIKLLWGTANLFSHPRYMGGAATNPNPDIFCKAMAQVKEVFDATMDLGGENYVLWGGREGYETLLNTDLKQEADQFARFLNMLVDYKYKKGFQGTLLIEPKPCEPTKHQYDFDVAHCYAFLQKYGLEEEFKMNIEGNHATLAGHSYAHEVAYAYANGIFGSLDANTGDPLLGWDTDQFALDHRELTHVLYLMLLNGGFETGGMNFDAKVRRQSIDLQDLVDAHVGGIDALAKALLAAADLVEEGKLKKHVKDRYKKWNTGIGKDIMKGKATLEDVAKHVKTKKLDPKPTSGRQEYLENFFL